MPAVSSVILFERVNGCNTMFSITFDCSSEPRILILSQSSKTTHVVTIEASYIAKTFKTIVADRIIDAPMPTDGLRSTA